MGSWTWRSAEKQSQLSVIVMIINLNLSSIITNKKSRVILEQDTFGAE